MTKTQTSAHTMNDVIMYDMTKYISTKVCIERLCCVNNVFYRGILTSLTNRMDPHIHALRIKNKKIIRLCIEYKIINIYIDQWAIIWSTRNGDEYITELLLKDKNIDPCYDHNACIRNASRSGWTNIFKMLMNYDPSNTSTQSKVDPSDYDNMSIVIASGGGHLDIVKMLLSHARQGIVDPCDRDNEAFKYAFGNNKYIVAKELLTYMCDCDIDIDNIIAHVFGDMGGDTKKLFQYIRECITDPPFY